MKTVQIDNYTFDKVAKTITFTDVIPIALGNIVSITDVTNGIQIFYNKLPNYVGEITDNVLTLMYNTNNTQFNNSDSLLIEYIADNYSQVVLSSSLRTATGNSSSITNYGNKGLIIFTNTTAVAGTTPALILKLQMQDIISGTWKDIPGAITSSIEATGTNLFTVYPGITESANAKVSFPLPRIYRVAWTITGTDTPSFTFSVGAHYIK